MTSSHLTSRIVTIGVVALGAWLLSQGAADAATWSKLAIKQKSGTVIDSSSNANTGTVHGGVTRTDPAGASCAGR
jgi:hypothetical protein